jgi:hypothetical protein
VGFATARLTLRDQRVLVKCVKESAGKMHGTSGKKIANVNLKWAFSETAVGFLRNNRQT